MVIISQHISIECYTQYLINLQNERTTQLQWPDYYPEDCPPKDAITSSLTVYRLVKRDPAETGDFIPLYIEKPENFVNKPASEVCQGCGISVLKDIQDVINLQNISGKMRRKHIAEGHINQMLGMTKHTPSRRYRSHHTWWVPNGIKPRSVFKVISEHKANSNYKGIQNG